MRFNMPKKLSAFSILSFVLAITPICAYSGTLTYTLGFQNFPEGVSLLPNRFTLESPPSGVFSVSFYIDDYDGLPLQIDNKGSDGWTKEFDMGSVRPAARLHVVALSLTGDTLESQVVPLEVIPAPHWMTKSTEQQMLQPTSSYGFPIRHPSRSWTRSMDDQPLPGSSADLYSSLTERSRLDGRITPSCTSEIVEFRLKRTTLILFFLEMPSPGTLCAHEKTTSRPIT